MKAHEVRELSDAELKKRIADEQEALSNMKFQKVTSQVENTSKFQSIRKDIARMKTILRERAMKTPATEKP